jgi:guanylate kinase
MVAPDSTPGSNHRRAGSLFVVSAPSGAGKTSLVAALLEEDRDLQLSVSFTTRARRPGEVDGQHYHFVDQGTFDRMVKEDAFVEYARVFGNAYGTAESALRTSLQGGRDLLLEIDWQGASQVRQRFPEAISIFIVPPSLPALEERLRGRGQDSDDVIRGRMDAAKRELSHWAEYQYLVVNDRFEHALRDLQHIIAAERLRSPRQAVRQWERLGTLLSQEQ